MIPVGQECVLYVKTYVIFFMSRCVLRMRNISGRSLGKIKSYTFYVQ